MLYQIIFPAAVFALTGGPSQPETESFSPIDASNSVDLFTGDFNYNIPLLDVKNIFSVLNIFNDNFKNEIFVLITFTALLIIILSWLLKTDFGIAMRATGNSESMVRAMGVDTQRMKITGLAIANSLTALSGYLVTQYPY